MSSHVGRGAGILFVLDLPIPLLYSILRSDTDEHDSPRLLHRWCHKTCAIDTKAEPATLLGNRWHEQAYKWGVSPDLEKTHNNCAPDHRRARICS